MLRRPRQMLGAFRIKSRRPFLDAITRFFRGKQNQTRTPMHEIPRTMKRGKY